MTASLVTVMVATASGSLARAPAQPSNWDTVREILNIVGERAGDAGDHLCQRHVRLPTVGQSSHAADTIYPYSTSTSGPKSP